MENFGDRLLLLMEREKQTQYGLAKALGVSSATINRCIHGDSSPSFEVVQRLCRAFPSYNITWLITGDGAMLEENRSDDVIDASEHRRIVTELQAEVAKLNNALEVFMAFNAKQQYREPVPAAFQRLGKTLRSRTQRPATVFAQYTDGDIIPLYFPGTSSAPAAA